MRDGTITAADVLSFKPADDQGIKSDKWTNLKNKISEEVKDIKWTASMPSVAEKTADLLNIKIPDILIAAWTKAESIKKAIAETQKTPGKTVYVELSSHTINSEYNPYIEIRINGIPRPKKIIFKLLLSFDLEGFILKIQDGLIKEIQTGKCMAEGQFFYQELELAKKKLFQLDLPEIIINE